MGKPQRIRREYIREKNSEAIVTPQQNLITKVLEEKLLYDYTKIDFNDNDREELIQYEKDILLNKARVGEIALKIGEVLENARVLFDRYSTTPSSYIEWYTALGFNKDQVSLLRGRYKLSLSYPQYNNLISEYSDREVKALVNKKVNNKIIENILSSGIRTDKKMRKAISSMLEIEDDVMDAEVVESEKDKKLKKLSEIDSKIVRLEEEIVELKKYRAKLQEEIKYLM